MRLRTISVGRPALLPGTDIRSAIVKIPVDGPVLLRTLGLDGDEQADLRYHGGPEKAVCVYPGDHYPFWERELGQPLPPTAFGENWTVDGLTEEQAQIGDTYRVGTALVQVCQPRIPCHKISRRFGIDGVTDRVAQTGYTGFYLRVLQEGTVQTGDELTLVERHPDGQTVAFANRIFHQDRQNRAALQALLKAPGLAQVWAGLIREWLGKHG